MRCTSLGWMAVLGLVMLTGCPRLGDRDKPEPASKKDKVKTDDDEPRSKKGKAKPKDDDEPKPSKKAKADDEDDSRKGGQQQDGEGDSLLEEAVRGGHLVRPSAFSCSATCSAP